ncbi:MAG: hypothetical protein OHK0039_28650 [Bacteroidia bacterium]
MQVESDSLHVARLLDSIRLLSYRHLDSARQLGAALYEGEAQAFGYLRTRACTLNVRLANSAGDTAAARQWLDRERLYLQNLHGHTESKILIEWFDNLNLIVGHQWERALPQIEALKQRLDSIAQPGHTVHLELRHDINGLLIDLYASHHDTRRQIDLGYENLELNRQGILPNKQYQTSYALGIAYSRLEDADLASYFFNRCIDLTCGRPSPHERDLHARSVHYLAALANTRGDTLSMLYYTEEAVDLFRELRLEQEIPPLLDLASYYMRRDDHRVYDSLMRRVDTLVGRASDPYHIACADMVRAEHALLHGDRQAAIALARHAYATDISRQSWPDVLAMLDTLCAQTGAYSDAYHYQRLANDLDRARLAQTYVREMEQVRNDYARKELAGETERLLTEQRLQQAEIRSQRRTIWLVSLALGFSIVLLALAGWLARRLKTANNQLQSQARALIEAKETAEKAMRAKSDFLSVMSHEIRTPLNAVIGMTHLLLDEEPREEQIDSLRTIEFSSRHLLSLINDILDYSKIEAGRIELEQAPFRLDALARGMIETARVRAQDKDIAVECWYDPALPTTYVGDQTRLGQVLHNLLSNAVKFTDAGRVLLRIEDAGSNALKISISDTGIGIDAEAQRTIFDKFSQATPDTTRKYGGTGLGLAITRHLVELMGSRIGLTSTPGQGSTFFFVLNLPVAETQALDVPRTQPRTTGSLHDCRVLVAEDNPINQKVIERFLIKWGMIPTLVNNGQEAVEALQRGPFCLVLMDVQMPVMDGVEATRRIRSLPDPGTASTPIVALTASALPEEVTAFMNAGMNDLVAKPFNPQHLLDTLGKYARTAV